MAEQGTMNGVDTNLLKEKAQILKDNPELAQCRFKVTNQWDTCGHNETTIKEFHAVGEDIQHEAPFTLEADEPPVLLGSDSGPNPVEHLLNALVSCLTTSMVYHAAVQGIQIDELESTVEGELDLRGFMGISSDVPKGYKNIKVSFRAKSDGHPKKLRACALYSPVFNTITQGANIEVEVETT